MTITTAVDRQPSAAVVVCTPGEVLAAVRNADLRIRLAEADKIVLATTWADLNPVTGDNPIPARLMVNGDDVPAHPGLAGVAASAVAEFAAQLGVSTFAGTSLVADGLEIRHRLPHVWDLVLVGGFHLWRARQLAAHTVRLNDAAVGWLDRQAALAGLSLGPRQLDQLVARATALHDPAKLIVADPAECFVKITHDRVGVSGLADLDGRLTGPDAADLESALQAEAARLAVDDPGVPLAQRRAAALGGLARAALGQDGLPGDHSTLRDPSGPSDPSDPSGPSGLPARRGRPRRTMVLYVHLSAAALGVGSGAGGTELAEVPAFGSLVTADVVRDWCGRPDASVTVTPVVDTTAVLASTGDVPSVRLVEQVGLRDRTCVFPFCHRPAHPRPRAGEADHRPDLDHIDPRGAGGQTSSVNLAPLCRRHHRLKTFTRWRYRMLTLDGTYLWTGPTGGRFLRTRLVTVNLDTVGDDPGSGPSPEYLAALDRARARIATARDDPGPPGDPPQHTDLPDDRAPF